jgi:hypothetical protein
MILNCQSTGVFDMHGNGDAVRFGEHELERLVIHGLRAHERDPADRPSRGK